MREVLDEHTLPLADKSAVEPAEYYGLMICPLVLAYEVYGNRN